MPRSVEGIARWSWRKQKDARGKRRRPSWDGRLGCCPCSSAQGLVDSVRGASYRGRRMYLSRIALAALEVLADPAGLGFSSSLGLASPPSSGGRDISITVLPSGISPLPSLAAELSSSFSESS